VINRYSGDVLAGDWKMPKRGRASDAAAVLGSVVEEVTTDWVGEIVAVDRDLHTLTLEDRRGHRRTFPLARASRIFVEGKHDAELVERVWGDDLRVEGVVVELLEGVDELEARLRDFGPGPGRRVGVLVDHLVPGSKESRVADAVARSPLGRHVLVVGHPFIDIWAAVKPDRLGLRAWPDIPRTIEWKKGVCAHLGWPHETQADTARAWRQILAQVRSYDDCEPELLGRVEELIDFVTAETEAT